jgi:hypothetical protein
MPLRAAVTALSTAGAETPTTATPADISNGRFYEGVCQAPLELRCSVVHWRLLLVRLS